MVQPFLGSVKEAILLRDALLMLTSSPGVDHYLQVSAEVRTSLKHIWCIAKSVFCELNTAWFRACKCSVLYLVLCGCRCVNRSNNSLMKLLLLRAVLIRYGLFLTMSYAARCINVLVHIICALAP